MRSRVPNEVFNYPHNSAPTLSKYYLGKRLIWPKNRQIKRFKKKRIPVLMATLCFFFRGLAVLIST